MEHRYTRKALKAPGNYRPVSLTSIPCKIMESIIKDCIMGHLLDNELIQESQHGFMPGKSCATNLVEFMDFVTKAVDEGKPVDIFYLDFTKAFDKVPPAETGEKDESKGTRSRCDSLDRKLTDGPHPVCLCSRRKI